MEKVTTGNYLIDLMLAGVLGIMAHIVFLKLPAVKKRSMAANVPFDVKAYFKDDAIAIIASVLTVVIVVFLVDELVGYNPSLLRFIKGLFVFVGYTGSSILINVFGVADKVVLKVIDAKTNELDGQKLEQDGKM